MANSRRGVVRAPGAPMEMTETDVVGPEAGEVPATLLVTSSRTTSGHLPSTHPEGALSADTRPPALRWRLSMLSPGASR